MLNYDFLKEFLATSSTLDNRYKVLQTIGEGRYAKVKLALDLENQKKYAIKIMREDQVDTPVKLEAFFNEVSILSSISHRNIVQIVHVSLDGEYRKFNGSIYKVIYYVMKYAEHGELFEILHQFDNFPEKIARFYFHQLIQSVKYLHEQGIGHRDIKTENILIDRKFNLKLGDFGCATKIFDHKCQRISFDNQVPVGSPEYNAPEISNNEFVKGYYAEDIDVFASASALFVMMLKSIPFNNSRFSDPYYARLCKKDTSQFWKIFDTDSSLSAEFKDLIERMMHSNPQKRISIKEIINHAWYLGPLPHFDEVVAEMVARVDSIRTKNIEKLRERHHLRLRKHKEARTDPKIPIYRENFNVEVESLKESLRSFVKDINMKLHQGAADSKLAKMMDRMSTQSKIQHEKMKPNPNKDHKKGKFHRKNRNSETTLPNEDSSVFSLKSLKIPRKQSRSFAGEANMVPYDDEPINQVKPTGSGTTSPKEERMGIRRSGSDD